MIRRLKHKKVYLLDCRVPVLALQGKKCQLNETVEKVYGSRMYVPPDAPSVIASSVLQR